MSYIDYINRFWKHARLARLNSNDISMFFYLLDAFNSAGKGNKWSSAIKINSGDIIEFFGIHRNTLHEILNKIDLFTDIKIDRKNGSKWIICQLKPTIENMHVKGVEEKPAHKPAHKPTIEIVQPKDIYNNINKYNYINKDFRHKDKNEEEKIKIDELIKKAQLMVNYN